MKYSIVKNCRCCNAKKLNSFFDFGKMNLSTEFPLKNKKKTNNKIPMNVKICGFCKLVQLQHNYDLKKLYNKDYGYKSGVNKTMNLHLESITKDVEQIIEFKKKDVVLDIASNDGTLLKKYKKKNLIRFGIDPTINKFKSQYPSNYLKYSGFFKKGIFQKKVKNCKAKVITSIAVFYDIPNPELFTKTISEILDKDGVWVLEQSYFPSLLANNAYDSLCHEHLTYFIFSQLNIILEKYDLKVFNVKLNDMNGGSIRIFICHKNAKFKNHKKNIDKIKKIEKKYLTNLEPNLKQFKKNILISRKKLKKFIKNVKKNKKIIHVYGASTKGNIILQFCNFTQKDIECAADRNEDKWSRITPGSNIPIISEKSSRILNPNYYLVMPWHFKDEILKRENLFLKNGGKLVFPLPKLEIISK